MPSRKVSVVKIGGSVLTGTHAYRRVASWIGQCRRSRPDERIVAVVSAESGTTDALLAIARGIVPEPDPATVDLLWSSGETRSAALLALHLHALGVVATATNVHQAGVETESMPDVPRRSAVRPLRLLALLDTFDVVVVPGFLARGGGDRIVSLGRGGSDLTAVTLAAGLRALRCELVKDVAGYFTADPKSDPSAEPLRGISYLRALEMADEGCELVQRPALLAARESAIPLIVRALESGCVTTVNQSGRPDS